MKFAAITRLWFHFNLSGKGDLVGCDISQHLANCQNGQGGSNQHGQGGSQDVIVKSSSDVKVSSILGYLWYCNSQHENIIVQLSTCSVSSKYQLHTEWTWCAEHLSTWWLGVRRMMCLRLFVWAVPFNFVWRDLCERTSAHKTLIVS